jgi:acetyl/propionyl-CoA carboxylase alpha subunit
MKALVANRGEIACRILRTLREMGIPSVGVFSDVDRDAPHVWMADEAVELGGVRSYLDIDAVIAAARKTGATAIHPGYGFLSQSAPFARACREAKITFVGPSPEAMVALGDKRGSRKTAEDHGIPVVPGERECDTLDKCKAAGDRIGYPILIKAAGGGGGKGMRLVREPAELAEAFEAAKREASSSFNDDRLIVEKYVSPARHVEVQILGDGKDAVSLAERECSLQRRYQKVIEEGPSAAISPKTRQGLFDSAAKLARAVGYANAGTVEFLVGPDGQHYFLEVNTRLQVEHPVTEMVLGMDIVRCQIEIAQGGRLPAPPWKRGHAIEARVNAEDPYAGFLPQSGKVLMLEWPHRPHVRVDAGIREGTTVQPFYDPLLAKVIAWGEDRELARRRLIEALRETVILGVTTNQPFLLQLLESEFFVKGETFTTTLESLTWSEPEVPAFAKTAAKRAMGMRTESESGGPSDRYSPWTTLGTFGR